MSEFLSSSDQFMWSVGRDPRLRSTIVTLVLLERSPDWDQLVDRFDRVSRAVPRFRQRVSQSTTPVPPCWEFDPDFDLSFHLHRTTAAPPGTPDALLAMASSAAMADYARARPLWEATLIEGLADGRAALLCRFDHALTDGVGAVDVARILYDGTESPEPRDPLCEAPRAAVPRRLDGARRIIDYQAELARIAVSGLLETGPTAMSIAAHPVRTLGSVGSTVASMLRLARPTLAPGSPIMVERSIIRRVDTYEVPKSALRRAGHAAGGTLNDAFLGAVTGGLRRYHEANGAPVGELVVSMPISTRVEGDPMGGNRATLIRFGVPADIADAAQRIRMIHARTAEARSEKSLAHTELIAAALNLMPSCYVGSALRHVDFIASDVPGVSTRVFLAGAPVRMQYAFSPTMGAGLNVTLLSYLDTCGIGINVDVRAVPDLELFRRALIAGFDETLALAAEPSVAGAQRPSCVRSSSWT